jgi:hypothetical protein
MISPKSAAYTTISKCNVVPAITTLAFSTDEVSCNLSTWAVGNGTNLFVSLSFPELNFVGDGTTVACTPISDLIAPHSVVVYPCEIDYVGYQRGVITINTDKTIIIAAEFTGGPFIGFPVKVVPVVITYSSY